MFRRFRYKDESGEWRLKWKKRIKDEKTGKYKWIDYDKNSYQDDWTGKGYYKSAAQNAMRVTRTETNIAYRRADNERWAQMDFVLGQRVQLSRSHPRTDICDKLQGDYPKEFVFDGWHPQCYSDDSEVLTQEGWKLFAEVQDNDNILSLNPETRDIEYVGIFDRQRYERNGDMVHFFNRFLDCLVTPEHQMVYLNKSDGRIERCRADEFRATKGAFYRGCNHQYGKEQSMIYIGSHCVDFDDYCEFMGYWLADGSLERNSGIAIAQKRGQSLCGYIANCIKRLGFIPKQRDLYLIFYNNDFNAFLQRFGRAHDKYIPNEILSASKRQIRIFLNAFVQCDGSIRKSKSFIGNHGNAFCSERNERMYYTTSPKMAAQIGELLLKIGLRPSYSLQKASVSTKKDGSLIQGNYDCWRISECKSQVASEFKKEIVPYSGYVYDLSLERNHIMYIRRSGKCFWGSNCFCFVTPILVDEDEMVKCNEAFLKGEKYTPQGKQITEYPEAFKEWVQEHSDKIAAAREKGSEPYFIRNNKEIIDNILNPKPKELTTLEKAKLRHDARTPEQRQAIIDRWEDRKHNPLVIAANRHASRTQAQIDDIKNRWQQRKNQMQATSNLDDVIAMLDKNKVDYNNVALLPNPLSIEDIIQKVGGGDQTSGSCASVAFAYAGNRCGFDVLDFRGGNSLSIFSRGSTTYKIAQKVGGFTSVDTNAFTCASELLRQAQKGKEYYFTCGRHAAIVRMTDAGKFEYLELQSSTSNGFKPLTTDVLKRRFGAQKQYKHYGIKMTLREVLIDIDLLKKDAQFRKMLGYINTAADKQMKGKSGSIK